MISDLAYIPQRLIIHEGTNRVKAGRSTDMCLPWSRASANSVQDGRHFLDANFCLIPHPLTHTEGLPTGLKFNGDLPPLFLSKAQRRQQYREEEEGERSMAAAVAIPEIPKREGVDTFDWNTGLDALDLHIPHPAINVCTLWIGREELGL